MLKFCLYPNESLLKLRELHPEFVLNKQTEIKINELLKDKTPLEAAQILGNDLSNYKNSLAAGLIVMTFISKQVNIDVDWYLDNIGFEMNNSTKESFVNNKHQINLLLKEYDYTNYRHDYTSASCLYMSYLSKKKWKGKRTELPTLMFMRVACQLHFDFEMIKKSFIAMCLGKYACASPTLFNAGKMKPQMSSCFLRRIDDKREDILKAGYDIGLISSMSAAVGMSVFDIRFSEIAKQSMSSGLPLKLKSYDAIIKAWPQENNRPGASCVFLCDWHLQILDVLDCWDKDGNEKNRIDSLKLSIWSSWLLYERAKHGKKWTLFCPAKVPSLKNLHGKQFEKEYIRLENDSSIKLKHKKIINAKDLIIKIAKIQINASVPHVMLGDSCNFKSNHRHIGIIKNSNLCQEVVSFSSSEEINSCNLTSIPIHTYVKKRLFK